MMSGTPNRNIETRYLNHLHTVDPDLYNVAMRIGTEFVLMVLWRIYISRSIK